jgi:outer membrane protein assembly factor BamA
MAEAVTVEQIAEEMYKLIAECEGKKNLKPGDVIKAMQAKFGETCTKDDGKKAIRILIDSERCVYSYLGGSYIQLPPKQPQG